MWGGGCVYVGKAFGVESRWGRRLGGMIDGQDDKDGAEWVGA